MEFAFSEFTKQTEDNTVYYFDQIYISVPNHMSANTKKKYSAIHRKP